MDELIPIPQGRPPQPERKQRAEFLIEPAVIRTVARMAAEEGRTASAMYRALVLEALRQRLEKEPDNQDVERICNASPLVQKGQES